MEKNQVGLSSKVTSGCTYHSGLLIYRIKSLTLAINEFPDCLNRSPGFTLL